jgi:O-antigen ligase
MHDRQTTARPAAPVDLPDIPAAESKAGNSWLIPIYGIYMWIFIHRPFEICDWLGDLRFERVYMLICFFFWLVGARKVWIRNPLNGSFLFLVAVLLISWIQSPFRSEGSKTIEDYLKMTLFYLMLVTTSLTREDLKKLVLFYSFAVGLYMLHSLWEFRNGRFVYRMGFSRMIGVDSTYNNPNSFSATILFSLTMVYPIWCQFREAKHRWAIAAYVALSLTCIILTGSRTAFISLLVLICLLLILKKRLIWMIAASIALLVLFNFIPDYLQNRFLTVIDPSLGPENALVSAQGRWEGWKDGVRLFTERPLLGYGPGAFKAARGFEMESHNLYGQVLGETGLGGAVAFVLIVASFFSNSRRARQIGKMRPDLAASFPYQLSAAVAVAVFLLLVQGLAGHNLYRYTWLWFGAFQIISIKFLEEEGARSPPIASSLAASVPGTSSP